jgi:hypothetical protein
MTEKEKGVIVSVIEADARNERFHQNDRLGLDVEVQSHRLIGVSDTHY